MQDSLNAYDILGLSDGLKATEADIGKAYKKMALKFHPDKARDISKEEAALKFLQAASAKELLSDVAARAALDALLRAKMAQAAKFAGQDAKRRKLREQLEHNERTSSTARSEEQVAKDRLQGELARLRREAAAKKAAASQSRAAPSSGGVGLDAGARGEYATPLAGSGGAGGGFAPPPGFGSVVSAPPVITEELLRTLKVSWSAKEASYTSQQIRDAFAEHGVVQDIMLREAKKKSRRSAIVVMASRSAAAAAAQAMVGHPSQPLLVTPVLRIPTVPPSNAEVDSHVAVSFGAPAAASMDNRCCEDAASIGHSTPAALSGNQNGINGAKQFPPSATQQDFQQQGKQPALFPIDLANSADVAAARRAAAPLFPIGSDPTAANASATNGSSLQHEWESTQQHHPHCEQRQLPPTSPQQPRHLRVGGFAYPGSLHNFPVFSSDPKKPAAAASDLSPAEPLAHQPVGYDASSTEEADLVSEARKRMRHQLYRGRQSEVVAAERARERSRIIALMEAEDEAEELAAL